MAKSKKLKNRLDSLSAEQGIVTNNFNDERPQRGLVRIAMKRNGKNTSIVMTKGTGSFKKNAVVNVVADGSKEAPNNLVANSTVPYSFW